MNPWRTKAVTLKSTGETIHVLPREIDGLFEAGLIDKGGKSTRVRVTPKADAKVKAAKEAAEKIEKAKADKAAEKEAEKAEKAAKDKEEKEAGKTKEEKNPGGTKTKKVTGKVEVAKPAKRPVNITSPKA